MKKLLESNGMGNGINNDNYVLTENISNVLELNIINLEIFQILLELKILTH